jgi:hypothetical protein
MKINSLLPIILFGLTVAVVVRSHDQQTQQIAMYAAVCLLAMRAGSSSARRSDLQVHHKPLVFRRLGDLGGRADRAKSLRLG